jgi:hypothetical protein
VTSGYPRAFDEIPPVSQFIPFIDALGLLLTFVDTLSIPDGTLYNPEAANRSDPRG